MILMILTVILSILLIEGHQNLSSAQSESEISVTNKDETESPSAKIEKQFTDL
jgi:hypothetical protein